MHFPGFLPCVQFYLPCVLFPPWWIGHLGPPAGIMQAESDWAPRALWGSPV